MSDAGFYPQVFLEAAHTASIVPFSSEAAFYAMRAFGQHDMTLPAILAIAGGTLGHAVNWWLGKSLTRAAVFSRMRLSETKYHKIKIFFDRYGVFLLLFSWLPLWNFLSLAAGVFHVRMQKTLLFVVIGLAAHYGLALWN